MKKHLRKSNVSALPIFAQAASQSISCIRIILLLLFSGKSDIKMNRSGRLKCEFNAPLIIMTFMCSLFFSLLLFFLYYKCRRSWMVCETECLVENCASNGMLININVRLIHHVYGVGCGAAMLCIECVQKCSTIWRLIGTLKSFIRRNSIPERC